MSASAERTGFSRIQARFTAFIREPGCHPIPEDIEPRRMHLYRDLVFGNVSALLAQSFPVLHRILGADRWTALTQGFFARHRSTTPLFTELPREFVDYLRNECPRKALAWPFIPELAHYEWVELALTLHPDAPPPEDVDPAGDLLEGCPVVAPLVWRLAYHYPLHRIGPDFLPEVAEETRLIAYRNAAFDVRFTAINALTDELLALIEGNPALTGRTAIERIALRHPGIAPDTLIEGGRATLDTLHRQSILIGTRSTAQEVST